MTENSSAAPPRGIARLLGAIERLGNALPHPATLFAGLALMVILLSGLLARLHLTAIHPGTGELIEPVSLLSLHGLHRILTEMVTNFTAFAPLGTVLVSMLGIGIAERSGLIGAALRLLVLSAPRGLLTFLIVFAGILSNTASEVGYVLLVPLGAIIFLAVGRHPLAGLAAAFAGVSGGYSANLLLGTVDPLLSGLSEEAARIIDPAYQVNPDLQLVLHDRLDLLHRDRRDLGDREGGGAAAGHLRGRGRRTSSSGLSADEKRGLLFAGWWPTWSFTAFLLLGTVPADGFLRDPDTGDLLRSPFTSGIVAFIFLGAAILGVAYGIGARTIKNDSDAIEGMAKSHGDPGHLHRALLLRRPVRGLFQVDQPGTHLRHQGSRRAEGLRAGRHPADDHLRDPVGRDQPGRWGRASAKWAIMAPVFIPMFMLLGYSPELVQATYRVGDSVTNVISPLMSYFPLIVAFMKKYEDEAGIGTVVATMLPYSVAFFMVWTVLLIAWFLLGLPVGPGAPLKLA